MIRWHKKDVVNRVYLNLDDGKKCAMPRYYKNKLYTLEEREDIAWFFQQEAMRELEKLNAQPDANQKRRDYEQAVLASYRRMYQNAGESRNLF